MRLTEAMCRILDLLLSSHLDTIDREQLQNEKTTLTAIHNIQVGVSRQGTQAISWKTPMQG